METFEDAHQDLAAVVDGFVWTLGPAAEAALRAFERQPALPRSIDGTSALSPDQEATILLALGQDAKTELVRSAVMNRQQAALRDGVDPRAEAILSEKAHSVIYKAVAQSGSRASISAKDREALAAQFRPDTIGFIERELAYHASQELDMSWSLGPPRSFFEAKFRTLGIDPTLSAVRLVRQEYLLLFAALLEKPEPRYAASVLQAVLRDLEKPAALVAEAPTVAASRDNVCSTRNPPAVNNTPEPPLETPEPALKPALKPAPAKSFTAHVETLIRQNLRSKHWNPKTASQHMSVARMFVNSSAAKTLATCARSTSALSALCSTTSRRTGGNSSKTMIARSRRSERELRISMTTRLVSLRHH